MKTTIALKLMKIVAQSHNHKGTYVHFLNMHSKKLKKTYHPTLPQQE